METGEILRQIRRCGDALPLEALAAAMERREDVIPGLLEILASAKSPLFLEAHYVAVVSALYLLAALRWRPAAPVVTDLFAPPEGTPSALDEDEVLFEDLGRIFASIYQGDVEEVHKLLERKGAGRWTRNSAIISLAIAARAGHGSRDAIAAYCGRLIAGGMSSLLPEERDALAGCVVELGLDEFAPQIDEALDKELILAKVRIMSKITSKLQVTLPKALADRLRLRPGDEIDWQEAGDALRVLPHRSQPMRFSSEMRLRLFDDATQRQRRRQARRRLGKETGGRGWTREELYGRGRAD